MDDESDVGAEDGAGEAGVGELTAKQIRSRIVELDDQVRGLPAGAFAEKYRLQREADELRGALSIATERSEATLASWAERAAGKNAQAVDDELEFAKTRIFSPGQNSSR